MLTSSEWKSTLSVGTRPVGQSIDASVSVEQATEAEQAGTWDGGDTSYVEGDFVSVSEVYEMAAEIGKEFEILIDRHGGEAICTLMPKVIHVLEELEEQAARRDSQLAEVTALRAAVERLESDKEARARQRLKDEQETLKIEENWRAETAELEKIITNLNKENVQLTEMIESVKSYKPHSQLLVPSESEKNETIKLLQRLKDVIDAQKVELRSYQRILSQRTIDLDAMKLQVERLAHMNAKGARCRLIHLNDTSAGNELPGGMAAYLTDELKELETRLRAKRVLVEEIRHHIGLSPTNCQDANNLMTASMRRELNAVSPYSESESKKADFVNLLNADDKMDTKSLPSGSLLPAPSSPRFTYDELRQILVECMQIETSIIRFRDHLDVYLRAGDDEPPVQGPINREPKDKIRSYPRPPLTVKLLFEKLVERIKR